VRNGPKLLLAGNLQLSIRGQSYTSIESIVSVIQKKAYFSELDFIISE